MTLPTFVMKDCFSALALLTRHTSVLDSPFSEKSLQLSRQVSLRGAVGGDGMQRRRQRVYR